MLERRRELDELGARIQSAVTGDGGLVVVEGPAGIGKSRLLAHACKEAAGSMRVLSSRGGEMEGEFAFGVVRQLFEGELRASGPDLLAGAAAPASVVFGAPAEGPAGAPFAALHGLFWLVLALAEREPVLLAVDDLHWADRPSLLFLDYLARRVESQPILVLLGLREGEPGMDTALLAEITRNPAATGVRPGPLSPTAVAEVIEARLGATPDPAFVDACHQATGGNPLLLSQLGSALYSEGVTPEAANIDQVAAIGPRAVSRTVLRRLVNLTEDARAVARAVSVLGEAASIAAVADLAEVDDEALAEASRLLAGADILAADPPLRFVHPLVRDAIYHELSPAERDLNHRRSAAMLRDRGAPLEQVAAQLLKTSPRKEAWVTELLWQAGRAAMSAGAADSAVAYLRRAQEEAPDEAEQGRLLFELGVAETHTTGAGAVEHLGLAVERLRDPELRATAVGLLARTLIFTGAPNEAVATVRREARAVPEELADLRRALEALEYMAVFFGARGPERLSRLSQYRGRPEPGFGSAMLAAMASWHAVCTDGVADECAELALAALSDQELLAADSALVPLAAMVTLIIADRPEVTEVFDRAISDAHRRGSLLDASSTHLWYGYSQLRRGDLTAAEDLILAADKEFTLWGHDHYSSTNSSSFMAAILTERGRPEEAARWLDQVGEMPPFSHAQSSYLTAKAALLTGQQRAEGAVAAADELAEHCAGVPDPARLWWRSLKALALDQLDRRDEAFELAHEELEITRAFGARSELGRTLRVLGMLEREQGIETLRESVEVLSESTARLERAKALAALGSTLRRARKQTEARQPLRQALELASACGADGLAESIRSELHAAGARPRRDALTGVEALTPSERRVAALAAGGRTNREIAQELYVTPKTVELHLSNAYQKLGIRSRRELDPELAKTPVSA